MFYVLRSVVTPLLLLCDDSRQYINCLKFLRHEFVSIRNLDLGELGRVITRLAQMNREILFRKHPVLRSVIIRRGHAAPLTHMHTIFIRGIV